MEGRRSSNLKNRITLIAEQIADRVFDGIEPSGRAITKAQIFEAADTVLRRQIDRPRRRLKLVGVVDAVAKDSRRPQPKKEKPQQPEPKKPIDMAKAMKGWAAGHSSH